MTLSELQRKKDVSGRFGTLRDVSRRFATLQDASRSFGITPKRDCIPSQRHPIYCVPGRVPFCCRIDGHDSSNVAPTLAGRVADTGGHSFFSLRNSVLKELKSKKNKEKKAPAPHRKEKTIKEKSQKTTHTYIKGAALLFDCTKKRFCVTVTQRRSFLGKFHSYLFGVYQNNV